MSISEHIIRNMVSSLMETKENRMASLDKLAHFHTEMKKVDEFITKQTEFFWDKDVEDKRKT